MTEELASKGNFIDLRDCIDLGYTGMRNDLRLTEGMMASESNAGKVKKNITK